MTIVYVTKQSAPLATTETDLYTVPAATLAKISTITVCNRGNTATTFRISLSVGGGATANKDYWYYDNVIPPNDTFARTCGDIANAGDKLRVYAGNASLSFNLSSQETS